MSNLESLKEKRNALKNELKEIESQIDEIEFNEYSKDFIKKYYKFSDKSIYDHNYIKVNNVWLCEDGFYIEGLSFFGETGEYLDCCNFDFSGFRQFHINSCNFNFKEWKETNLIEISKEEFIKKFEELSYQMRIDFFDIIKERNI